MRNVIRVEIEQARHIDLFMMFDPPSSSGTDRSRQTAEQLAVSGTDPSGYALLDGLRLLFYNRTTQF
jgi:hypothetical protein